MNFRVVIFAQAGKSAAFLGKDGCPEPGGSGGQLIEQLPQPVHGEQREHGGFRGDGDHAVQLAQPYQHHSQQPALYQPRQQTARRVHLGQDGQVEGQIGRASCRERGLVTV